MAAPTSLCRLCITTSHDNFKSLYDEHGQANGLYEMTYEYFHPKIVDFDKAKHLTAICLECFRHIHEFHSFQTSVTIAQLKLFEEDKTMYTISEDIETSRRESPTQTMAIKVEEEEEFFGLTPEYDVKKDCPQIVKEEFITLSDIQLEEYTLSTSKNNYQIIESLSIGGDVNEEEDIKDNISLPTLEIMDINTSSTYTTDDVVSSGQLAVRNPSLSENRDLDEIDTQTTDDQPKTKYDTLDCLLAKWLPNIKCFKCAKSFPKWPLLTSHFKQQHPNERFHYKCCSRKFSRIQIKDHLCLHDNPDAFKCSICDKRYANSATIASHYAESHPDSLKFPCDKCNKRCISKIGLANHKAKMHSSSQPDIPYSQVGDFKCSICDKSYARSTNLASHYAEMHAECAKFPCNKCGKRCISKQGLANHYRRVHSSVQQDVPDLQMHYTTPPTTNTDSTETKARLSKEDPTLGSTTHNEEDKEFKISLYEVPLLPQIDASSPSVRSSDAIDNQKSQKKYETLENLLAKWIPNIKCFKCKKSFPSWTVLKEHFKRQHPNEKFHYMCCSLKFNRFQIKDHLCLHGDYDAFKCSICGIRYKTSNSLALHNTVKHSESLKFPCDICGKRYASANTLASHQSKVHKMDRLYLPDLEIDHSPQTTSEDHLETTISLSMQEPVFHNADEEEDRKDSISLPPLEIMKVDAGSTFSSGDEIPTAKIDDKKKSSEDQPKKVHESLKILLAKWIPDIKCFICSKSFPSWSLAKSHFRLKHRNEKFYYKCCSRKFSQDAIKDHLRLHGDPNAFKCLICDKIFKTSHWLSAHNALTHTESLKISCDKCGRRFRSNIGLRNHQSKIHHSNRQDYVKVEFLADGRTAYNCQLCGETKYTILEFRQHKSRVHGWNTYKVVCTICGHVCLSNRTFREHMASHENKKIFKCCFCPAKYGKVNTMKTHRQRRHPHESGTIFYTYIFESESESNESPKSVKSTSATRTEKKEKGCEEEDIKDPTTILEDVNSDCETEQKYFKNEDCGEECFPTTSTAATAELQMSENKAKKPQTRKSAKPSRFGKGRKKAV